MEFSTRKESTAKRKEILMKKKLIEGIIKTASSLNDPLAAFPAFHQYNQQGLCLCLESGQGDKLSRFLKQYIRQLLKMNMERHYGIEWAAEEKLKYREMIVPEARYIFVYDVSTMSTIDGNKQKHNHEHEHHVVGFAHYRFTMEEELPVLYVYELQIDPCVQGKGLGKFLMQLLELIACKSCMAAIMLTVQKANSSAMSFYMNKLKYCVSTISPSKVDPLGIERHYEILCKTFDQEAKHKLE